MKKLLFTTTICVLLAILLVSCTATPTITSVFTTTVTKPVVTTVVTQPAVTLPVSTVTLPPTTVTLPQTTLTQQAITTTSTVTTTSVVTTTVPVTTTSYQEYVITTTPPPVTTTLPPTTTTVTTTSPPITTTVTTTSVPVTTTVTTTVAPTLTYYTQISSDVSVTGSLTNGSGSFTITVGGVITAPQHTLTLASTTSTGLQSGGMFPFYLQATSTQTTALLAYFGTMGHVVAYQTQIDNEVNGTVPFLYLSTSNGLIDGFRYALGISPNALTINDDYPVGTYAYAGTLIGSNGGVLSVTINLTVTH